ncbi:MAG: PqqD family peptide modification chaperone [Candidatus Methanofastidiosia archaeon]
MKVSLRKGVRFFQEEGNTHLLNAYTNNIVKIDQYGTVMFDMIREEDDFDKILKKMCTVYPEEETQTVKKALLEFVKGMESHNIFEVDSVESKANAQER